MTMDSILPGSRVIVFDSRKYKDDVTTPLSVTMRPATVVHRYGTKYKVSGRIYPDLIDIIFDGEREILFAYLTEGVKEVSCDS